MTKDEKMFVVNQLRKDKIIYATEAVATSLACFIAIIASDFLPVELSRIVRFGSIIVAIGYTIFMGIGNFYRLMKIKKLEKELNLIV